MMTAVNDAAWGSLMMTAEIHGFVEKGNRINHGILGCWFFSKKLICGYLWFRQTWPSCWTKITMELGLSNDIHDIYPLIDVMSVKIEPSHRWVSSFKICKISRIISAPGWWQNRKWWWVAHDALFFALILHAMTCSKVTKFRDIQAWTHGNLLFCRYQIFKSKPNWLEALASFSNRNMLDHLGPVCRTRFFGIWALVSRNVQNPPAKDGRRIFLGKNAKKLSVFYCKINRASRQAAMFVRNWPQFSLTPMLETLFGGFSHCKNNAKIKKRGVKNHSQQLGTCWTCWARQKQHDAQKSTKVTHHFP